MAQAGYIFGKGTPDTYESLQSKRRTAERLGLAAMRTPQNLGEGLSSLGQAIAYRRLMNQADAGDAAGTAAYFEKRPSVLGAALGNRLGGAPFNPGLSMPVTANPAGLDPSIIAAVDRVNPQGGYDFTGISAPAQSAFTALSDAWGKPLKINSGYRDPAHNAKVGGAKGSQHVHGNAFDVDVSGYSEAERMALIEKAKAAGFRGIGVYDNALHFDVGPERAWGADYTRGSLPPQYADVVAGAPQGGQVNPGASIPAIMELLSDPYAPQGDKMVLGMLLEQQLAQMQPPDPMQALEMERARLEIDQMRNPQMADAPQVETFYDETTGQQYKAQWNGQEWVPVGGVQAADGPMVDMSGLQIGGDNVPADDALRKKLMEGEGVAWGEYLKAGGTASGMAQDMDVIDELIQIAPQGPIQGRLAKVFPGVSNAGAAFQSVVSRVAPSLRVEGSGSTSDIEYNGFLQSMPSLVNRPDANAAIAGVLRAKAQINMDRAQVVRDYQNGTMSVDQARNKLSEIDSRSILTPGLKQMLTGLAPDAGIAPAPGATLTYNPQTGEFE